MHDFKEQILRAKIITVSGGKGGVGKTFFSVNLAAELRSQGYKVLIFDADLNLSNVNIMTHINADIRFVDFLYGNRPIEDVIQKGVGGIDVIYAGEDLNQILKIESRETNKILSTLRDVEMHYDYIIIDTSAGLDEFNINLMVHADTAVMVTTPVITALTDLYRVIKMVSRRSPGILFDVVINQANNAEEAAIVYQKVSDAVHKFGVDSKLNLLGYVLTDSEKVIESIQKRVPIVILHEGGSVRACFNMVTREYLKRNYKSQTFSFFSRLIDRLR